MIITETRMIDLFNTKKKIKKLDKGESNSDFRAGGDEGH